MNRSSNSSSGGFIYFNREFLNKHQSDCNNDSRDSQDYLAFNNSPAQINSPSTQHGFSPSNFSSPKFNPRHSLSPYQYHRSPRGGGRGYSTNNFNNSPNNSRNFSQNQNRSWQRRGRHSEHGNNSSFQKGSTSVFYDPTCLANPWSELEKELAEKIREENKESIKNTQNTESPDSEESEIDSSEEGNSSDENEESR